MRTLYVRSKLQSLLLSVFIYLEEQGLIHGMGLTTPIDFIAASKDAEINRVCKVLECFSLFKSEVLSHEVVGQSVLWLAVLIVRGAVEKDLRAILDRIRCSEILGKEINTMALDNVVQAGNKYCMKTDRYAAEGERLERGCEKMVAFWLPNGLGGDLSSAEIMKVCRRWEKRVFQAVEDLFLGYIRFETRLLFENWRNAKDEGSLSPGLEKKFEGVIWSMESAPDEDGGQIANHRFGWGHGNALGTVRDWSILMST